MKINFIPLNKQEKNLLTKKAVMKALEKKILEMFITQAKISRILRKYETI